MFYSLRYVWPFVVNQRKRYVLGFLMALIENVLKAVPTFFIGRIIDQLIKNQLTMEEILLYFAIVVCSIIGAYFAAFYWTVAIYGSRPLAQKYFQDRIINYSIRRRQRYYEKFTSGDLMSRSTMDVDYLTDLLSWGMSIIIYSGTMIVVYFILMIRIGGMAYSILSISPFSLLLILSHFREKESEKRWQRRQKAFSIMNDKVLEGVEGVQNIRVYAQEEAFEREFQASTANFTVMSNSISRLAYTYGMTTTIAEVLVFAVTIYLGSQRVSAGLMSIGALVTFQLYVSNLAFPITNMGQNLSILQNANVSAKRINEIMTQTDGMEDAKATIDEVDKVHIADYSFSYPSSEEANLDEISLDIPKGAMVGVVGKTGAGKTTFLRQFLRQYPAGSGVFEINGLPLADIAPDGLSQPMGYVAQSHSFYSGTVRENVAFSVDEASDEEIIAALELANFPLEKEGMPQGLDTLIGEKGVTLSGGQRQRLSIARAFIKNPDFLILDDSLSAVDAITEKQILANIFRTRRAKTTLISSHRLSAVEQADFTLVFDEGKITERGNHEELMELGGWYASQFIHQFQENEKKVPSRKGTINAND